MNLAFLGCCALAQKDGVGLIKYLPDATYRRTVGSWEIALNGETIQAALKFNGWPAGIIDPAGGIIAAGDAANEDSFIAAIEADLGQPIEAYMSAS
jgi:hypothetical protein